MSREWSVRVETVASEAVDPNLLVGRLHDRGIDVCTFDQVDTRRVGASVTVRATDLAAAAANAIELVLGVLPDGSSAVAVEAMTAKEQDRLLALASGK
jgi:hypothetical protein